MSEARITRRTEYSGRDSFNGTVENRAFEDWLLSTCSKETRRLYISNLHQILLRWYTTNQRPLPWRRTRDPYRILISEIMLQQTQVNRVLKKYPLFLKQFPTIQKLASTSPAAVIQAWQGMGYNNRVLRLRDFAKEVVEKYHGKFPSDVNELTLLRGIGQYTAHAIACFAFGKQVPVVDVNVRRLLSRIFWKMRSLSDQKDDESIWKLAQQILPKEKAYHWNQALMDLGATICTARKPLCGICPIANVCVSAHERLYDGLLQLTKKKRTTLAQFPEA